MTTIPASLFVAVTPSVLPAVGDQLDVVTMAASQSNRVPIGAVYSFALGSNVTQFFGSGSPEDIFANGAPGKGSGYFGGYSGEDSIPGALLFAQYNAAAVPAYLWGGDAGVSLTLAQLQALSGTLTVVMDGFSHATGTISFAGQTSFSGAAAAMTAAFSDPTGASFTASFGAAFTASQSGNVMTTTSVTGLISIGDTVTGTGVAPGTTILAQTGGTTGGAGTYTTSLSGTASTAACTAASFVMDVTVVASGVLAVGQVISEGSNVYISAFDGATGNTGLYLLNKQVYIAGGAQAVTSAAAVPVVTYDSLSGAFIVTSGISGPTSTAAFATGSLAASLLLTQATGAFLSQGAAPATPATFMNGVVAQTTNFVCYACTFDPDGGSGNALKLAFAAWKNAFPNRYAYVCDDHDIVARANPPQSETMGIILRSNGDSGTFLQSELTGLNQAAFICGTAASIDFEETDGRITFAYKTQPGLVSDVTNAQDAVNLGGNPQVEGSFGNGYNYYGAIATANQNFVLEQRGTVTGPFTWFDSYIGQIWANNLLQNTLMNFLATSKAIPFNIAGATLIELALADPIGAMGNFGLCAPGTLSSTQQAEVNQAAGANIAQTLQTQGYYLQVLQQSAAVRANRGPWAITLWYLDRGAVQSITLASIAVE